MTRRWAAFVFLLLLIVSADAFGCSCVAMGGTCGAMKLGGTLFLGEVVGQRPVSIPMSFPGRNDLFTRNNVFRIRVIESFSGSPRVGEEVEVRTGGGGGDCGYGFEVGSRYLVDAYDSKADNELAALRGVHLSTGICSRTRGEASAGIALRELRTEAARGREPDMHGTLRQMNGRYAFPGRPMAGIQVTLTGQRDGAVYRAQTDEEGIYTFATLPPGDYRPAFALPVHQKLISYGDSKPLHVTIPANDGVGLACHFDAEAGPTGGVRVRVVDGNGKPVPGSVAAHIAGAQSIGSEWSDDGNFTMEFLADGDYVLEFSNYSPHMRGEGSAQVRDGAVTEGVVIKAAPFTR